MLFKKNDVPAKIKKINLGTWYSKLKKEDQIKLSRYIDSVDDTSQYLFFISIIDSSIKDENPKFAVIMCEQMYDICELSDYERYCVNEKLIDAYIGAARYEDAKAACVTNLELYPKIKDELMNDNNGKLPENLNFRNRYIDIIVGIDSSYDLAFEMLEKYNKMGILDDEELEYRKNSLKTHRLQRVFDGLYSYRPKGEDQ